MDWTKPTLSWRLWFLFSLAINLRSGQRRKQLARPTKATMFSWWRLTIRPKWKDMRRRNEVQRTWIFNDSFSTTTTSKQYRIRFVSFLVRIGPWDFDVFANLEIRSMSFYWKLPTLRDETPISRFDTPAQVLRYRRRQQANSEFNEIRALSRL